ncbi:hypothetical protein KCH_00490 [Kitasatospora cheerisanensis KCTC 2395]|uniref:Uncharacterized protein n=1 Tax=Kitasatospora cheerisanensis KCTC 2395 TaxID=1348663 RepID=A0A066Z7K4_9ACTN|nr:hypothetical protein KCH_00490 [Kitasatospora cheerisanensis KCTC 2395]
MDRGASVACGSWSVAAPIALRLAVSAPGAKSWTALPRKNA